MNTRPTTIIPVNMFTILMLWLSLSTPAFPMEPGNADPQIQIYFFLLEDCKITKAYIPEIRKIAQEYSTGNMDFKAVFSNPTSHPDSVYRFLDEYQLPMDIVFDEDQKLAQQFQIKVMPEVVVFHRKLRKVVYQGRIDNLFASLGKKRPNATRHELRDCLKALQTGNLPPFQKTEAIGCFLEKLRRE